MKSIDSDSENSRIPKEAFGGFAEGDSNVLDNLKIKEAGNQYVTQFLP